ncbi:unnamed protein product, partial [Dibothriocephalus latus]
MVNKIPLPKFDLNSRMPVLMRRLETAKMRIAAGEPPTDDAEEEFRRLQRRYRVEQEILANVKKHRLKRDLEESVNSDGVWTAAEVRPNAYLADGLQIT